MTIVPAVSTLLHVTVGRRILSMWPLSNVLPRRLRLRQASWLLLPALTTLGLQAQVSPAGFDLPSNQQVIAFLTESIDWYRHCAVEREIATEPVDLVFVEGNRSGAAQIVELSFDFARADAQFSAVTAADRQKESNAGATGSPDLAQLMQLRDKTELQWHQASDEIEVIKEKLKTARGSDRRKLLAALDAAQRRLDVLQAGLATLRPLVEFMQAFTSRETGDLATTIEDLARTVPDVGSQKTAAAQTLTLASLLSAKLGDSGVLALGSEVSALGRKLNILDEDIRLTESLRQSSDKLRIPLLAAINKRLPALADNALQASDLAELQRQKARLDELAALVNPLSPAVVALDKQRVLLSAYASRLKGWRATVSSEDEKTWKNLMSRLLTAAVVIAALVLIGALVRRVTQRHMRDTERRHVMLVIQRVVVWSTVVSVSAFTFATDLSSLITFFGLLAAGVAVALQSLILSAVGYFVLVGRRGIRIGDRVQISGVTGDVTDIGWLRFQVKEIDTKIQQPTGSIVTFSNSIVLASPSTGLARFDPHSSQPRQLQVAAKAAQQ